MTYRLLLVAVFSLALANTAFANWWIVRSSDGHCLVVDVEPTGSGITKMGKEVYQTKSRRRLTLNCCVRNPRPMFPARRETTSDYGFCTCSKGRTLGSETVGCGQHRRHT